MDIPTTPGSSTRSAFAVVTPAAPVPAHRMLAGIRRVSNSADTPATLPPLLKLNDIDKGSDLLAACAGVA